MSSTNQIELHRRDIQRAMGGDPNRVASSELVAAAVLWHLSAIAEAVEHLPEHVRDEHPEIDWGAWASLRTPSSLGPHPDALFIARRSAELDRIADATRERPAPTTRAA